MVGGSRPDNQVPGGNSVPGRVGAGNLENQDVKPLKPSKPLVKLEKVKVKTPEITEKLET